MNFFNQFKNNLSKNIASVALVIFLIKIIALYKQRYIGSLFGLTENLDIFYILLLVPFFIQSVFIGAFKSVFIPNYIREKSEDKIYFHNNLILMGLLFSLFLVFILLAITNPINNYLVQNYSSHVSINVYFFQYFFIICIPFWVFTAILSGFLDINKRFSVSASYPIISSFTTIIFLYFNGVSISSLVFGSIVGSICEFIYLLFFQPINFRIDKIKIDHKSSIILYKQFFPKLLSGLIIGLNPIVDQIFCAHLAIGAISLLNYANKLPAFILTILTISIGNVLLPYFSELQFLDSKVIFKKLTNKLWISFLIGSICSIFLFLFSENLISIIFENGLFNQKSSNDVSLVLKMFSLQIPFYLMDIILVRFLTAFNLNKFNVVSSSISIVINILANYLLITKYGISGIALSTSIVYFLSFTVKFIYVYIKFNRKQNN